MTRVTTSLETVRTETSYPTSARARKADHRFFLSMALTMTAAIVLGFTPTYFGRSYFHGPSIPFWVHVHGAVFTAWISFYLLQNVLALKGGMRLHRRLGISGAILASLVVVMGLAVAVRQARQGRFFPFPDIYSSVAVSTVQMLLFAAMVALGLLLRRDAETHKRLMMMSLLLFFFPAVGRLLHGVTPPVLCLALCFYLAGPVYDLVTRRRIHPAYRWGVPLLILTTPPFAILASHASPWRHFVDELCPATPSQSHIHGRLDPAEIRISCAYCEQKWIR